MNPQVLYCEFLSIWNEINTKWSNDEVAEIIISAIRSYLNNNTVKGCIMFDGEKNMCRIHTVRPLACRMYGITPKEEFEPKYTRLKVLYPKADIRNQCGLVSTVDGREVTTKDSSEWWEELKKIEVSIGVPERLITDAIGGTYRTLHDHIMMTMFPKEVLIILSKARLNSNDETKEKIIKEVFSLLKKSKTEAK